MIMKPYGAKHRKTGPCICEYCSYGGKLAIKRRERSRAKLEVQLLIRELSTDEIKFSKKEYIEAAKKAAKRFT